MIKGQTWVKMSVAENKSEENDIKTPVLDRKMIILRYSVEKQLILYAYVLMLLNAIQVNTKVYLGLHIMPYSIIKEVKVRLWSKYDVHFVANNDVNILAGINGSGKTSLLPETNKLALVNINGKNLVVLIPSVDKSVISKNTKKKII